MPGKLDVVFYMIISQLACVYAVFENITLYEVTAFNTRERALLYYLYVKNNMIIFANGITNEAAIPMDVIVDNCCSKEFEEKMTENDIEYAKVALSRLMNESTRKVIMKTDFYPYAYVPNLTLRFHNWEMLKLWVETKLQKFPSLQKIKIAETYEKRDVFALKISSGTKNSAIFLLGGEDGKDWMSSAILLNFVEYILEKKSNVDVLTMHYDFYILPLLNPDGFEYSITQDFSWAPNRKVYYPKTACPKNITACGIKLDRNWFFSTDILRDQECDPVYSGSRSLSQDETSGLARFLDSIALDMLAFINVRGFENLVTIPYGYSNHYCNNYPVLLDILASVHDRVVEEHNKTFFYGTAASFFYNFTGNVADWVKKKLNTPIVYTIYMKSNYYVLPNAEEVEARTGELSTMMKEIILLAGNIYSPLFNSQSSLFIQVFVIIINILSIKMLNEIIFI